MKKRKVCLNFNEEKKEFEVYELNFLERIIGLMLFRKKLLFNFKNSVNYSIHSFFCPDFYAVWLDDKNEILEIQFVKSWKLSIKSKNKFNKLIEIPVNEKNKEILKFLVGVAKGLNTKLE